MKIKEAGVASCTKVMNKNLVEMRRVMEEAEQRVKQSNLKQVLLPTSSAATSNFENSSSSASSIDPRRRKGSIGSIEKAFNMGAREIVDSEIARMFYIGGLSFHFDRNPFYARAFSINDRRYMSPIKWWVVHETSAPMLQSIALKFLEQPCSSSCCERNWSIYNFIHSMKRNKLTPQRAKDLVYVRNNLRLLSRRSPNYNEGESKMWDIGGDGFDSMDIENAGIHEIADLSLDEPKLDDILFDSEGNASL